MSVDVENYPGRYLDIADTFHDMVKPPTSWTVNKASGRCNLGDTTNEKKDPINNLKQVSEWLGESPDYVDLMSETKPNVKIPVYHDILLKDYLMKGKSRGDFIKFLKSLGEADYEYWVMSLYNKHHSFTGIEKRSIRLKDAIDPEFPFFPDTKTNHFIMDALQHRGFFEHHTKDKNVEYVSCIASEWDQATKDSGSTYKVISNNFQSCGLTGNYVKFHHVGNKNVVMLYRDGDGNHGSIGLDKMSLSVLNLGVSSLCKLALDVQQTKPLNETILKRLIRTNIFKTDKNKNGKRPREGDNAEPILDVLYNFLVKDNTFLYYNLFNIKRSGDYGQIAATKILNTDNDRYYLITIDKLCYLRAKMEETPCIRVLSDGGVDAYHGKIDNHTILLKMYETAFKRLSTAYHNIQQSPDYNKINTTLEEILKNGGHNKDVTYDNFLLEEEDTFHKTIKSLGGISEMATALSSAYKDIFITMLSLINARKDVILNIIDQLKHVHDSYTFNFNIVELKLDEYQEYLGESTKFFDKYDPKEQPEKNQEAQDRIIKLNDDINIINEQAAAIEFYNSLYNPPESIAQIQNAKGVYNLEFTKQIFSYKHANLPETIAFNINDDRSAQVFNELGLTYLLKTNIIQQVLKTPLPRFERLVQLSRGLSASDRNTTIELILRKFFGFMYNISGRITKRSVDVENYKVFIIEAINHYIQLYSENQVNIVKKLEPLLVPVVQGGLGKGEIIYVGTKRKPENSLGNDSKIQAFDEFWDEVYTPYDAFYDAINHLAVNQSESESEDAINDLAEIQSENRVIALASSMYTDYNITQEDMQSSYAEIYAVLRELRYFYFMANTHVPIDLNNLKVTKESWPITKTQLDNFIQNANVTLKLVQDQDTECIAPEHIGLLQEIILQKWHNVLLDIPNNFHVPLKSDFNEEDSWNVFFGKTKLDSLFSKEDHQMQDALSKDGGKCKKNSLKKPMRSLNRDYYYTSSKQMRAMLLKRTIKRILARKTQLPSIF
jgi:hypothetical protein